MEQKKVSSIDYMCSWCGKHCMRRANSGRPMPGDCPRKPHGCNGQSRPHTWVVNRKFYF